MSLEFIKTWLPIIANGIIILTFLGGLVLWFFGGISKTLGKTLGWIKKLNSYDERINKTEESIEKNKDNKDNIEKHDKQITTIENVLKDLKKKIDDIYDHFMRQALVQTTSPVNLTARGREILRQMSGEQIFEKHKESLSSMVEAENPNNAYDIQQISSSVVEKKFVGLLEMEELEKVKAVAYEAGITLEDVVYIFSILLRDDIIEQKGMKPSEIDDHEPKNKDS